VGQPAPRDDVELFIRRYGVPDSDESSENDKPRPTIVTRYLTYRNQKVRAAYRADVPLGAPPPYEGKWKLVGFVDPDTNQSIAPATVVGRLSARDNHYGEE